MKLITFGPIVGLVLLVSLNSHAVDDEVLATLPKYVICKNRKIVRTIRVTANENKECVTTYTKDGVDKVVGTAFNTISCFRVFENIQENLGVAGWKCKDISTAKMAHSN